MLQIKNIHKKYVTGNLSQTALNGISLNLRDSEFVTILGPSGSGKTTLLNIIGGLDRYDSGDLVINGISTKKYTDRDWDSYRNHTIGFVFQSYNLIPHQTILANVELALTISGISKTERKKRAKQALEQVGLGDQLHKNPNQLSGGQMQRVAIARALVNNPDILLADEPTGALDSETSVQVMDLIREIAKDRLVVMVTHNAELAEQYATRIVRLQDGAIVSDSNPYEIDEKETSPPVHKNLGKASMSFKTALSLSFNNLKTKKARTLLTSFAGSIGIIGIALILALSSGFQAYIDSIQRDALTAYPITIESSTTDIGASVNSVITSVQSPKEHDPNKIYTNSMTSDLAQSMTSTVWNNNLKALKAYLDSDGCDIKQYTSSIQYAYNAKMNIYSLGSEGTINQVYPNQMLSMINGVDIQGISLDASTLASYERYLNSWQELIDNQTVLKDQYDIVAGNWPKSYNEAVLIVDKNNEINEFVLQSLGITSAADTINAIMGMQNDETNKTNDRVFEYDDLLDLEFSLVLEPNFYSYNSKTKTWDDKHDDEEYVSNLIEKGTKIKIVGIIKPSDNSAATIMTGGIGYMSSLTEYVVNETSKCEIVKQQKANPKIDVFTGLPFETKKNNKEEQSNIEPCTTNVSLESVSIDMPVEVCSYSEAFVAANTSKPTGGTSKFSIANSANLINGAFNSDNAETLTEEELYTEIDKNYSKEEAAEIKRLVELMLKSSHTKSEKEELIQYFDTALEGQEIEGFGKLTGEQAYTYLQMMDKQTKLQMLSNIIINQSGYTETSSRPNSSTHTTVSSSASSKVDSTNATDSTDSTTAAVSNTETSESMDYVTFAKSYEDALSILGASGVDAPKAIYIYPINFEAKEYISNVISDYNAKAKKENRENDMIKYTDYMSLMMSSVTTIVNVISYVLIAFVAVSLIVSSIMIGIITYISVLERTKEIGILRAIGASKRNISQVFNAETFIIGFLSGLMGIGITLLLLIPGNAIIHAITGISSISAILPIKGAVVLIILSMVLTVIAGLIPSKKAAKKDPVSALRTE